MLLSSPRCKFTSLKRWRVNIFRSFCVFQSSLLDHCQTGYGQPAQIRHVWKAAKQWKPNVSIRAVEITSWLVSKGWEWVWLEVLPVWSLSPLKEPAKKESPWVLHVIFENCYRNKTRFAHHQILPFLPLGFHPRYRQRNSGNVRKANSRCPWPRLRPLSCRTWLGHAKLSLISAKTYSFHQKLFRTWWSYSQVFEDKFRRTIHRLEIEC
jgi:hypothetical protein